jgi:hypothetical protein
VLRVDVLRVDVLRLDVLRLDVLRRDVLRVDVLRVDVLRVDVLRVDVRMCGREQAWHRSKWASVWEMCPSSSLHSPRFHRTSPRVDRAAR